MRLLAVLAICSLGHAANAEPPGATPVAAQRLELEAFSSAGGFAQSAARWQVGAGISVGVVVVRGNRARLVLGASLARSYMEVEDPIVHMTFGAWNTTAIPTLQLEARASDALVVYPLVGYGLWTSSASYDCPFSGAGASCDAFPLWEDNHAIGRVGFGAHVHLDRYDLVIEPDLDYVFGRMPTGNPVSLSTKIGLLARF